MQAMIEEEMLRCHPDMRLSSAAAAQMVRIVTRLTRELERSTLRRALSSFYGDSSQLVEMSMTVAQNCKKADKEAAIVRLCFCELVFFSGNQASGKKQRIIRAKDVLEVLNDDYDLHKLIGYVTGRS
jgi:hypothetical protein